MADFPVDAREEEEEPNPEDAMDITEKSRSKLQWRQARSYRKTKRIRETDNQKLFSNTISKKWKLVLNE